MEDLVQVQDLTDLQIVAVAAVAEETVALAMRGLLEGKVVRA
jgi:hypothetical protein